MGFPALRKFLRASLFALSGFLAVYLLVVWLWASAVADDVLAHASSKGQLMQLQPRHLEALIKIEDPRFYEHHGLNLSTGQGLTTITSVLARELFLGPRAQEGAAGAMQSFYRGVFACCKRIDVGRDVMALVLNTRATKQQQLDMFLASTYFGSLHGKRVIGFEAAAAAYYGKTLPELTDREFYGLIAMPMAPNRYHPVRNPARHAERVRRIEAVVTGACQANGWLDLTYDDCAPEDRPE